jgi:hypothetical protein
MDFAMPFMIQTFREYHDSVAELRAKFDAQEKAAADADEQKRKQKEEGGGTDVTMGMYPQIMGVPGMLAIAAPQGYGGMPYGGQMNGGYGGGYMQ